ncbi:hypothetical protein EDC04DRAFT_2913832 [Pisolithus marmoratus]|nr:hypothetical protein EDC04DRAFT_2913832 [Pisolithus marmoratus]
MSQCTGQPVEVVHEMMLDWLANPVVHSIPGDSVWLVDDESSDSDEPDEFDKLLDEMEKQDQEQSHNGGPGILGLPPILFNEKEVYKTDMGMSEDLSQETAALEAATHDINHIAKLINSCILSFAASGPLCFSVSPHKESLEYDVDQSTIPTKSNAGTTSLGSTPL